MKTDPLAESFVKKPAAKKKEKKEKALRTRGSLKGEAGSKEEEEKLSVFSLSYNSPCASPVAFVL